jgi:hypothetical protein
MIRFRVTCLTSVCIARPRRIYPKALVNRRPLVRCDEPPRECDRTIVGQSPPGCDPNGRSKANRQLEIANGIAALIAVSLLIAWRSLAAGKSS